jgi:hypothetical protein
MERGTQIRLRKIFGLEAGSLNGNGGHYAKRRFMIRTGNFELWG